jgi:hypothetical protein
MGIQCRLCGEVILDEETAHQILGAAATISEKAGTDPLMAALAMLTAPLLVWGGIHVLVCKRTKMN